MSDTVVCCVIGVARNVAKLPFIAHDRLVEPRTHGPPAPVALFKTPLGDAHRDIDIYKFGFGFSGVNRKENGWMDDGFW